MKTTVFFALALTAVLMGLWREPAPPHDRPPARSAGAAADQRQAAAPVPQDTPVRAPALPPREAGPAPGSPVLTAGPLAPTPSSLPASPPTQATADAGSSASDWRDDALDLLSQIGLLCPAAGCDSLEDD